MIEGRNLSNDSPPVISLELKQFSNLNYKLFSILSLTFTLTFSCTISDAHNAGCLEGCREAVHVDCSCQKDAKHPKHVLSYVFPQREKVPAEEMLAMTREMFNARRIDLEAEFSAIQRRSRYLQVRGRSLLNQGAAPANLNAGGGPAQAPAPEESQLCSCGHW